MGEQDQERSEKAEHHAAEAERLLKAAGKSVFQFADPMINTREQALMRAGVHAALANYYALHDQPQGRAD